MESDSHALMNESGPTAPGGCMPAALEADGPVKSEADAAANQVLLERLVAMAHSYRSEGNPRQARELYWALAENHPGTPQADAARAALLEMAASYGRNEARHMARSIYERLLNGRG